MTRLRVRWLIVLLAIIGLGGCLQDCPSCSSLREDGPKVLSFQLCVSQLPDPEASERGCGDVEVEYVIVRP
jgi:hypothetical protein